MPNAIFLPEPVAPPTTSWWPRCVGVYMPFSLSLRAPRHSIESVSGSPVMNLKPPVTMATAVTAARVDIQGLARSAAVNGGGDSRMRQPRILTASGSQRLSLARNHRCPDWRDFQTGPAKPRSASARVATAYQASASAPMHRWAWKDRAWMRVCIAVATPRR